MNFPTKHDNTLQTSFKILPLVMAITFQAGCSLIQKVPHLKPENASITEVPLLEPSPPPAIIPPIMAEEAVNPMVMASATKADIPRNKQIAIKSRNARSNPQLNFVDKAIPAPPAPTSVIVSATPNATDKFKSFEDNPIKQVSSDPVSTFSLDVDTGSYTIVRRTLQAGSLPPADAVRTEELINYFQYDYPNANKEHPFAVETELSTAPWNTAHYLLRIGVQAQDKSVASMPPANLVFLVDVSGSMNESDKLPLVVSSLKMLTQQLRKQDTVSLVVYAGHTAVVLKPTSGENKQEITNALEQLSAGGSTAGASGLQLAYNMARQAFITHGINRVLLATDGDFNVGVSSTDELKAQIKRERESGITLSTLGFGRGNYNDEMMEQIADVGNGNYSYIDSLSEARKVLVDEMSSTFQTVAKDVKVQIEFNPNVISEYRLIGYENRQLKREDFNNDKVDAGDVGAGKSVTAIYELTPKGAKASVDPLRYAAKKQVASDATTPDDKELAFLKLRYKQPEGTKSILWTTPINNTPRVTAFEKSSVNQRFATAVAGFGQLLRHSDHMQDFNFANVIDIANTAKGTDASGLRAEFVQLAKNAEVLAKTPNR